VAKAKEAKVFAAVQLKTAGTTPLPDERFGQKRLVTEPLLSFPHPASEEAGI
ncbi:MAG: hypothetical protein INR62_11055, partial [Rhodospirillales bacterium]|nr:hypothetical protein [Acetobacter sp.]